MSYTTNVKAECASLELRECCKRAQLSALLKLCAEMSISSQGLNMVIRSENPTVAKRILKHLKDLYNVESQLSVMKKLKLKKNNVYILRIFSDVRRILEETYIMSERGLESYPAAVFLRKDCCIRAYLAGSFLATGSVNDPKNTNYHLEISSADEKHANFLMRQMNKYNLNAKVIKRRNMFVVYIKAADKISDFLNVIGAHSQLAEFEDFRIERDFMNSLKRLENCEVANEMKTQQAAKRQIEDILYIRQRLGFTTMDPKIKQVAMLRLDHPEASLNELCMVYEEEYEEEISKSGMKHRLAKIKAMADRMRESVREE